jgi:hypothetical protein
MLHTESGEGEKNQEPRGPKAAGYVTCMRPGLHVHRPGARNEPTVAGRANECMPGYNRKAKTCMRHARKEAGVHSLLSMHSIQRVAHAGRVTRAEVRLGTQIRGGRKLGKEFAQEGGNPTEHGTKESFDRYHVIKE